jgi:hypothetical protein
MPKPPRRSVGRKLVTTESTNVIPAPAERSDSWKVYIHKTKLLEKQEYRNFDDYKCT